MTDAEKYEQALEACHAARAELSLDDVRAWIFGDSPPPRPAPCVDHECAADAWHEVLPRSYEITWTVRTEWGAHYGRTVWRVSAAHGGSVSVAEHHDVSEAMVLAAAPLLRGCQS